MQYTIMQGAEIHDETTHGCRFMFGGVVYQTPRDSYKIVNGELHIKQHVAKNNLRGKWRGETTDQWKTAHPIDESVLADIVRVKEIIQQITRTEENSRAIEEAIRVLDHGIGNARELYIAAERLRRDRMMAYIRRR